MRPTQTICATALTCQCTECEHTKGGHDGERTRSSELRQDGTDINTSNTRPHRTCTCDERTSPQRCCMLLARCCVKVWSRTCIRHMLLMEVPCCSGGTSGTWMCLTCSQCSPSASRTVTRHNMRVKGCDGMRRDATESTRDVYARRDVIGDAPIDVPCYSDVPSPFD